MTTTKTRRDREKALVAELQRDHGYLFSEVRREADRHTTHFGGDRSTGRWKLTPARVMNVSMPTTSWLARRADEVLEEKRGGRRGRATPAGGRRTASRAASPSGGSGRLGSGSPPRRVRARAPARG